MKKILFIFGTRPEAIKLAPVICRLKRNKEFQVRICLTGQHQDLVKQVLDFFRIKADYDLKVMKNEQDLFSLTAGILSKIKPVLKKARPDMIMVQGDTLSAFTGALAGFYDHIKICHLEAGLRSFTLQQPYPEELNRIMISHMADHHFIPTNAAKNNLKKEGIRKNLFLVGNTVIDAVKTAVEIIDKNRDAYNNFFHKINFNKKVILITCHRRESFGKKIRLIAEAIKYTAKKYSRDIEIIFPVHLNPAVSRPVKSILKDIANIHLLPPLTYPCLLFLMQKTYCIITDSGGIQEEASCFNKPVLILRDITERLESVKAGVAKLIGTDKQAIMQAVKEVIEQPKVYKRMTRCVHPYGNGDAAFRIEGILKTL